MRPEDRANFRTTKSRCVLKKGSEYWLEIKRRAADDLEHLTGSCLLLQRLSNLRVGLGQRTILLLQLREQPHILDRDHGLVSESLEQGKLRVGKWARVGPSDGDRADRFPGPQHRDRHHASERLDASDVHQLEFGIVENIGYGRGLASPNRPCRRACRARRLRETETNGLGAVPIRAHDGGQVDELAVEQKHVAVFGVAEAERAVRNSVKDWLDVGR